jgi:DNA-directed RNA polymerase specialized sigma24 family protein
MAGISGEADGPGGRAGLARADPGDAVVAVTDLFRDHHLELVRLALVMVGDLATAEDVVQDAFERLHRGWHGLRQPSSSLAYVRASVLNGCRSVHRRAAVARKHAPRLAEPPSRSGPDAAADDRGELAGALRRLPRRYYLDLDVAEIAGTLRIAPSSVRAANARGLAALARALGEG